jgi:outer membrane lipoprotein LolB
VNTAAALPGPAAPVAPPGASTASTAPAGSARALVLALAWLGLAGCASVPPDAPAAIAGRLTLQVAAHQGEPARGFNASFDLVGDGRAGELRLSTPLGPQIARARWAPGEATIETADGVSRHADLDTLARHAFGEPVPLQALPDWLRGRPWPGAPNRARDDGEAGFEQLGWTIGLARQAEGFVVAARRAAPAATLRVRLLER